jgi:hypothetical protein
MKHWCAKSYRANWSTCTNTCPSATYCTYSPTWTWLNMAFCYFRSALSNGDSGWPQKTAWVQNVSEHGDRYGIVGYYNILLLKQLFDNIHYGDLINLYSNLKRRKSRTVRTLCHLWVSMFVPFKRLNQLTLMKSWYHRHATGRAPTPLTPIIP